MEYTGVFLEDTIMKYLDSAAGAFWGYVLWELKWKMKRCRVIWRLALEIATFYQLANSVMVKTRDGKQATSQGGGLFSFTGECVGTSEWSMFDHPLPSATVKIFRPMKKGKLGTPYLPLPFQDLHSNFLVWLCAAAFGSLRLLYNFFIILGDN